MTDAASLLTLASAGIVGIGIASAAMLRGWKDYLALKRLELEQPENSWRSAPVAGGHELQSLKERVRKLEAIACGVDF